MIESEDQLQSMVNQAEHRERKARRNALLLTLVPILVAIGLVAVTGWQVQKSSQDVIAAKVTLDLTQKTQGAAEVTLSNAEANLGEANLQITEAQVTITENSRVIANSQKKATQAQKTLTSAMNQVADQQQEIQTQQAQIDSLKKQADELNEQLKLATHFQKYNYEGNLEYVYKHTWNLFYANQVPEPVTKLIDKIFANMKIPWNLFGTSFTEGVNSPTYVALMLDLLPQPASFSIDQETLMAMLPLRKGRPQVGDVVYYAEGLTFFYFEDEENQGVLIGMTPFGIVSLNPGFDTPLGIGKPKY